MLVNLIATFLLSPLVIATVNGAGDFLSCENQIRDTSTQALIEFGIANGLLAGDRELSQILDLVEGRSSDFLVSTEVQTSSAAIFRKALLGAVQRENAKSQLVLWLLRRIAEVQTVNGLRTAVHAEVEDISLKRPKMEFIRVKGGLYWVPVQLLVGSENLGKTPSTAVVPVEIPYDFEVLTTPVTQAMWLSVMGELPSGVDLESDFFPGHDVESVAFNGGLVEIARDYPVTYVSFASVAEFANRLSREKGVKEAYKNLKVTGNPQSGTAQIVNGQMNRRLRHVSGYRLLSEAEWAVLLLEAHLALNKMSARMAPQLLKWAWLKTNSNSTLHAVGKRDPFVLGDGGIFDLLGLVEEQLHAVSQVEGPQASFSYDVIDEVLTPTSCLVSRGGTVVTQPFKGVDNQSGQTVRVDCSRHESNMRGVSGSLTGFRLARTLKKQEPK